MRSALLFLVGLSCQTGAAARRERCGLEVLEADDGEDEEVGMVQTIGRQRFHMSSPSQRRHEQDERTAKLDIASVLAGMKAKLEARNRMAGGALVVMGNPGGDMDSVADALSLATFLQEADYSKFLAHNASTYPDGDDDDCNCCGSYDGFPKSDVKTKYDGVFPVINFKREYLHLRKDIQYVLLDQLKINESSLIFIDEIYVDNDTRFFLVDHNAINAPEFQDPDGKNRAGQVDFVVDHHSDQTGGKPEGNIDCYIMLVGSASSLVGTLIKQSTEAAEGKNFLEENPQWATLLLAVEHQDWDPEKTKPYDKDIMVELSQWSLWSKKLLGLKRDVTNFTVEDFFLKDAKDGNSGGIVFSMPSLPITNMTAFMTGADSGLSWTLEDFERQVENYLTKFKYDAVWMLKSPNKSPPPGELVLLTYNASLVTYTEDLDHMQPNGGKWYDGNDPHLQEADSPFAGLKNLSQNYWTFPSGSRKQMLPMVNDMLANFGKTR